MATPRHDGFSLEVAAQALRRWLTPIIVLVLFHIVSWAAGREDGLWLPGLGLALVCLPWFGWWCLPVLAADFFLLRAFTHADQPLWLWFVDSLLFAAQLAASWWCFAVAARCSSELDDPTSATIFLVVVVGGASLAAALPQSLLWAVAGDRRLWSELFLLLTVSRMLGLLTVAPLLLVVVTPWLQHRHFVHVPRGADAPGRWAPAGGTVGERIELAGLTLCNAILTFAVVVPVLTGAPGADPPSVEAVRAAGGISLLIVCWTGLRQGTRGGVVASATVALAVLAAATLAKIKPQDLQPHQGDLLAQTSVALLVGAAATWLRTSEMRYRRVVGHIPVILYSVRLRRVIPMLVRPGRRPDSKPEVGTGPQIVAQAVVTLVSQASRQLFGVPPETLEGPFARWLEIVHPADREVLQAALTQLVLQRQPVTCEYRIAAAGLGDASSDGAARPPERWMRDTLAPHHDEQGQLDGWDGVVEDISETRALSQDLRRTTSMLQSLVANLPTGVFFVQGELGQPILVNARARQLLGQREDLAAGVAHLSRVYRLHRPDGTPYPTEELPITKALRWGVACSANDIVVHRPDGRRVPLITWAAPVDLSQAGQPDAAVWVLEDLTSLHQAESARHESEARLRATFAAMAEGVLIHDGLGNILECNPAATAILGAAGADLIGKFGLGIPSPLVRGDGTPLPPDELPIAVALRSGAAVRDVVIGIPGEHRTRWLQVSCVPLAAGQATAVGNRARLVTTFADITPHREAQADLQKSQRLELVGRLASGVVHDFNNMLTALIGMAAIARGGLAPEHPVREDLTRIIDIGEQAANVAGQLLTFSKQRRFSPRPVDLNVVVAHTLAILKGALPHSIQLNTQRTSDDLWVLADETQLKQVLMNLCLNARDAMPQGGTLSVSTGRVARSDGTWITCSVRDTGCGMDQHTLEHLFEPFYTTKERGSGLGLAVVQQIIDQFGGTIDVTTKVGEGTCFTFWLRECPPPHDDWSV
ncbi:MAG: ATP-binding protein [Gemmataceae bacterium]|nr:ATP-binding protein [Gemmataceae bacterium]